uniref:Uncharacterized protein n=1 Tax=Ditylenchus dipsaci TaxID=166011 RepID=A0A915EDW3_9BILA
MPQLYWSRLKYRNNVFLKNVLFYIFIFYFLTRTLAEDELDQENQQIFNLTTDATTGLSLALADDAVIVVVHDQSIAHSTIIRRIDSRKMKKILKRKMAQENRHYLQQMNLKTINSLLAGDWADQNIENPESFSTSTTTSATTPTNLTEEVNQKGDYSQTEESPISITTPVPTTTTPQKRPKAVLKPQQSYKNHKKPVKQPSKGFKKVVYLSVPILFVLLADFVLPAILQISECLRICAKRGDNAARSASVHSSQVSSNYALSILGPGCSSFNSPSYSHKHHSGCLQTLVQPSQSAFLADLRQANSSEFQETAERVIAAVTFLLEGKEPSYRGSSVLTFRFQTVVGTMVVMDVTFARPINVPKGVFLRGLSRSLKRDLTLELLAG